MRSSKLRIHKRSAPLSESSRLLHDITDQIKGAQAHGLKGIAVKYSTVVQLAGFDPASEVVPEERLQETA
jgi:hypothetical protein